MIVNLSRAAKKSLLVEDQSRQLWDQKWAGDSYRKLRKTEQAGFFKIDLIGSQEGIC